KRRLHAVLCDRNAEKNAGAATVAAQFGGNDHVLTGQIEVSIHHGATSLAQHEAAAPLAAERHAVRVRERDEQRDALVSGIVCWSSRAQALLPPARSGAYAMQCATID